jgi:cellulase
MKTFTFLATIALAASSASAHTIFQELYVNGKSAGHLNGIRVPEYNGVREL